MTTPKPTKDRPLFLANRPADETGRDLKAAYRELGPGTQQFVEFWLLRASVYGSMTWQERCLWDAIENEDWEVTA